MSEAIRWLFAIIIFLVLLASVALAIDDALSPVRSGGVIIVERGDSARRVIAKMSSAGFIDPPCYPFYWLFRRSGLVLKAGNYSIERGKSLWSNLEKIAANESIPRRITIPPGLSAWQITQLLKNTLARNEECLDCQTFRQLYGNSRNVHIDSHDGSFFPDTYDVSEHDTVTSVMTRMQKRMNGVIDRLWNNYLQSSEILINSKKDLLIIASLVEKEAGPQDNMSRIASVFINRLRLGLKLQSDPTTIYAITEGKLELGRSLKKQDLASNSPYNTYSVYGLPPTPICNPGIKAIEATLAAFPTKDLYFVSNQKGGHLFAQTLVEHNKNVNRIYKR